MGGLEKRLLSSFDDSALSPLIEFRPMVENGSTSCEYTSGKHLKSQNAQLCSSCLTVPSKRSEQTTAFRGDQAN